MQYDHHIALDWAQSNMAIARMSKASNRVAVFEGRPDLYEMKAYLKSLKGSKVLTFEETTTAQWLYVELRPLVDELIVCDPYRNRLLCEGAKNDRIDATKLVSLLRSNLLKPVFHSADRIIELRKLVSGYEDLIAAGVRLKNQRSAIMRAFGADKEGKTAPGYSGFVVKQIDAAIERYEADKEKYEQEFNALAKREVLIRRLRGIPGIGPVNAVKILAAVVDAKRFPHRNNFLSYCGLVKLEKISGDRSYGSRRPRYRRDLKCAFKTAALAAIGHDCCYQQEYQALIKKLRYPDYKARHAIARRIATAALGVMKSGKRFSEEKVLSRLT